MPKINLTGLRARECLAYRAAMGLLQAVQEIPQTAGSRLSWSSGFDKHAVLTTEKVGLGGLLDLLDTFYAARIEDPRWRASGGGDGGKYGYKANHTVTRERYREMVREFEPHAHRLAWLRGTATDQAHHPRKAGHVMFTGWDTCRGGSHISVHSKAVEVMTLIAKHECRREAIATTLVGPWARQDECKPMGWDERQIESNAKLGTSTANVSTRTELVAMVFAIESLALYPVNARNGRARTAGIDGPRTTWATWARPVSLDTVVAVVDHPALHQERIDRRELEALGVTGVHRCYFKKDPNTQGKTNLVTRSSRIM